MSYSDLLRDPRWQRKRLEVLERENFTCQRCEDSTQELHVHHTHYVKGRKPWEYDASELRCLCKTCHEHITERTAEMYRLLGALEPSSFDMVMGLVRALFAYETDDLSIRVGNAEEAIGIALFFHTSSEIVLQFMRDDFTVDRVQMGALRWRAEALARGEPLDPMPEPAA